MKKIKSVRIEKYYMSYTKPFHLRLYINKSLVLTGNIIDDRIEERIDSYLQALKDFEIWEPNKVSVEIIEEK